MRKTRTLKAEKKREPIRACHYVPDSLVQVERYRKIQMDLEKRGLKSIHDYARESLDELMSDLERLIAQEKTQTSLGPDII